MYTLNEAYELVAKWHEKQAVYCEDVAKDEPRVEERVRKRAASAAVHHRASAASLRLMKKPCSITDESMFDRFIKETK